MSYYAVHRDDGSRLFSITTISTPKDILRQCHISTQCRFIHTLRRVSEARRVDRLDRTVHHSSLFSQFLTRQNNKKKKKKAPRARSYLMASPTHLILSCSIRAPGEWSFKGQPKKKKKQTNRGYLLSYSLVRIRHGCRRGDRSAWSYWHFIQINELKPVCWFLSTWTRFMVCCLVPSAGYNQLGAFFFFLVDYHELTGQAQCTPTHRT